MTMTASTPLRQDLAPSRGCRGITISIIGGMLLAAVPSAFGQQPLLDRKLGDGYRYIGKIQPRHARDIAASNWSIGAETMDRDYTVYANWREYLGPLGAKKARIQSGWAKTEKERGVYDWAWVDEIVLDMVDQGVEPWVCLCYGNPIYPGGGDTGLGGGLVASEEALQAWERYVAAFVERYAKHVDEWELWNEPRTGRGKGTVQYAKFVIRTAETIRKLQPDAEIMFAAGGSFDTTFAKEVLEYLQRARQAGLGQHDHLPPLLLQSRRAVRGRVGTAQDRQIVCAAHRHSAGRERCAVATRQLRGHRQERLDRTKPGQVGLCGGCWATWDATSPRPTSPSATCSTPTASTTRACWPSTTTRRSTTRSSATMPCNM